MNFSDHIIILATSADSPVSVMTLAPSASGLGESEEETLQRYASECGGTVVPASTLPAAEFRDAWRFNKAAKKITIDLTQVSEIILAAVRRRRNTALEKLDVPSMIAIEQGHTEDLNRIRKQKEKLRDLPPVIEARLREIVRSKKSQKKKLEEMTSLEIPELDEV